jgi:hypothetical protein
VRHLITITVARLRRAWADAELYVMPDPQSVREAEEAHELETRAQSGIVRHAHPDHRAFWATVDRKRAGVA